MKGQIDFECSKINDKECTSIAWCNFQQWEVEVKTNRLVRDTFMLKLKIIA